MPCAMPDLIPARTACDNAFTGGLLTVMIPILPSFEKVTISDISSLLLKIEMRFDLTLP